MNLQKLVITNIKRLKHLFIPFIFCYILSSLALTINPYFMAQIIGCFEIFDKSIVIRNILFWGILFIILKSFQAINQYFVRITKDLFETTFNANITEQLFNYVHHHNTRYFDDEMTGRVSTAITQISSLLYRMTDILLFMLIRPIINVIFSISIIAYYCPKLVFVIILFAIPFYFIIHQLM